MSGFPSVRESRIATPGDARAGASPRGLAADGVLLACPVVPSSMRRASAAPAAELPGNVQPPGDVQLPGDNRRGPA
ncbi:hypothetical protein [Frankia sp. CcWB2]